ncbi:MAG: hypothetical protein ACRERV_18330, partial [Methylococcales bacterium]
MQRATIVLAISFGLSSLAYANADETNDQANAGSAVFLGSAPYQDRIIASDKLAELPPDEEGDDESQGLPRSIHAEVIFHESRQGGVKTSETGISIGGFWETENWGSFSADAVAFRGDQNNPYSNSDGWRGSATIWQRGLNMPGGWLVNNGLGVLNTPLPSLLREQYRFFLPSVPM